MPDKITMAIHQPDFLPWLGVFDKIRQVDHFVHFDNVPISAGKSWTSRVWILLDGNKYWLTMPIKKSGMFGQKIAVVELSEPEKAWRKILGTMVQAYKKAPFFPEVFALLEEISKKKYTLLSDLNVDFIEAVAERLFSGKTTFQRGSKSAALMESKNTQTALIVETCSHFGGTHYLSGKGCLEFLEPPLFERNNIYLYFQEFKHPEYVQVGTNQFVPGLSIVDALMNNGFEGTRRLLGEESDIR